MHDQCWDGDRRDLVPGIVLSAAWSYAKYPAGWVRCPVPRSTSGQGFEQRPSLYEVRRREALRVGAEDGR